MQLRDTTNIIMVFNPIFIIYIHDLHLNNVVHVPKARKKSSFVIILQCTVTLSLNFILISF